MTRFVTNICKIIFFVLVFMSVISHVVIGSSAGSKLQIGVKKRSADCPIKSKKGDLLHVHYTKTVDVDEWESGDCLGKSNEDGVPPRWTNNVPEAIITNWMHGAKDQGTLEDGTEFDSSIPRGNPLTFTLGAGQVIKGWDQGMLGMCEGEQRKLVISPELAYGEAGAPPKIPKSATLTFHVDLVKIERKDEL